MSRDHSRHFVHLTLTASLLFLGIIAVGLITTASWASEAEKESWWQGRVVDASTGSVITNALLYLGNGEIVPVADGTFNILKQSAGPTVTAKAPGYVKRQVPVAAQSQTDIQLKPFKAKGIYIPFGLLALPNRVKELIDLVDQTELNCIVVDVKSDRGLISFTSNVSLTTTLGNYRKGFLDPKEVVRWCKEKKIYTIARMVVFKDNPLASSKPEWAVVNADGTLWHDREGLGWSNPFREEIWDYNIALAKEVATMGFDEIQFDYIRFPSDGNIKAIAYKEENTRDTRSTAIRRFWERLEKALLPYGVFTSADVFGLTVWVQEGSDMGIGQQVEQISGYVDYLCPMVYPSTFEAGNLGYSNPALYPYGVVYRSMVEAIKRSRARVRPWLQHYSPKEIPYNSQRLIAQRLAAEVAGAQGWTFWNAGGKYDFSLFYPEPTTD